MEAPKPPKHLVPQTMAKANNPATVQEEHFFIRKQIYKSTSDPLDLRRRATLKSVNAATHYSFWYLQRPLGLKNALHIVGQGIWRLQVNMTWAGKRWKTIWSSWIIGSSFPQFLPTCFSKWVAFQTLHILCKATVWVLSLLSFYKQKIAEPSTVFSFYSSLSQPTKHDW